MPELFPEFKLSNMIQRKVFFKAALKYLIITGAMPPKRSALSRQGLVKCRHRKSKCRLTSDDTTEQPLINAKYQKLPDHQFDLAVIETETKLTCLCDCCGCGHPRGGRGRSHRGPGVPGVPHATGRDGRGRGGHRSGGGRDGGDQRGAVGGAGGGGNGGVGGRRGGGGRGGGGGGGRRG